MKICTTTASAYKDRWIEIELSATGGEYTYRVTGKTNVPGELDKVTTTSTTNPMVVARAMAPKASGPVQGLIAQMLEQLVESRRS